MGGLPEGTITMLFSDIEGSTALLHRLGGERYGEALSAQRILIQLESGAGRLDRAIEVLQEALAVDQQHGDLFGVAVDQHSIALASLRVGRPHEAHDVLCGMLDYVAISGNTSLYVNVLELGAGLRRPRCWMSTWPRRVPP